MRILVFATTVSEDGDRTDPYVAIPDTPLAFLPAHPQARVWSYFVTTTTDDVFLLTRKAEAESAINAKGYFVFGKSTGGPNRSLVRRDGTGQEPAHPQFDPDGA
jgi:hypothetical protein